MTTAASLRAYTVKDLASMAKKMGLTGCSSMRKDQLIRALVRAAKKKQTAASKKPKAKSTTTKTNGRAANKQTIRATRKIEQASKRRAKLKDLSSKGHSIPAAKANGKAKRKKLVPKKIQKDRVVLLVRDPFWLQACWDVSRQSVERAQAAMAEHWHTAKPTLRVYELEDRATTSAVERVERDIQVHGGVKNWFIDVIDPPKSYRVDLGYLAENGKFFAIARSNMVTTPKPGSSDAIDENWTDVAEDYERIYAQSGGYDSDNAESDLRELFEERLRRPMGSPVVSRYGKGAERMLNRQPNFEFEVDAEMIIFGCTKPDAHVAVGDAPIKLRNDGTFTMRVSMPDRRQVLPVVASSADGVEQRTIVLAVERNTKVMEPMIRESAND